MVTAKTCNMKNDDHINPKHVVLLLEAVKDPARLELQVRMSTQLSRCGSLVGVTVESLMNRVRPERLKGTYAAKHFSLKSSASSERAMPSGTGGACFV